MVLTNPVQSSTATRLPNGPAALIVAHPGHEVRVHGWLCRTRPEVFVLTDGSGHRDQGRIESTARVLASAGASRGSVFGRLTDRQAYDLILEHREDELRGLVLELAADLERLRPGYVLSDAVEGLNPVHDLCYVMTVAALNLSSRRLGAPIGHYDILLDEAPDGRLAGDPTAVQLRLTDEELGRKLREARGYLALQPEVESALEAYGEEAFRVEVMYPARPGRTLVEWVGEIPRYESFGANRVEQGVYPKLLRFRQHFEPVASSLLEWSRSEGTV